MLSGLPAGKHVVTAKAILQAVNESSSTVVCRLTLSDAANLGAGPYVDDATASLSTNFRATLPLLVAGDIPSGGTAVLVCFGPSAVASQVKLVSIQVDKLTIVP
jgi:hypothetical protein